MSGLSQLLTRGILCLCILPIIYVAYQRISSPLKVVPGPYLASVTPLWRVYHVIRGDWHDQIVQLHQKYGQYVRIAPNEVSTISPSALRVAYSHSGSPWIKDTWYQTWWGPSPYHPAFAETEVQRHRIMRRRVSKLYSMSYVLGMQCYTDRVLQRFFQQMRSLRGESTNMTKWTQLFAFDIIGELAFGDWFGGLDAAKDNHQLGHWVFLTITAHASLGWTWLRAGSVFFFPVRLLMNRSLYARARVQITTFPLVERNTLILQFQAMKNPDGSVVHPREILTETANVVLAGADTTAISLRAVIYYVYTNPRIYAQLLREIGNATRLGKLSPIVTFQEALELDYLQVVIKEALRLFPAVGYQLPRLVPPGGATLGGYYFPGGTTIGTNAWALHRNTEIYGSDCDEFRPERWLNQSDPNRLRMMEDCYGSFGFGSRTCLGKNLALMEMYRLLPTLFRDFDVEVCNPQNPWKVTTGWFAFSNEFQVRISARDDVPPLSHGPVASGKANSVTADHE
ncbi:cytochrome P450 family protein [Melanomma pulvis-pyrius CBS 109.77]|uniref:Cytochrome P450 family protein n=1 Tax=Melanomma pulvis-pyrius CBS 109.77 TaxID=1314802 RepID=A0A6A6WU66_9PLEO|nr:cytochrome P450 family protein [Melanomma pulvis-pyrius CBS 109.77]